MSDKAEGLLMMFINDLYKSSTGKVSKKTALAASNYILGKEDLQNLINSGDSKKILRYRIKDKGNDCGKDSKYNCES